MPVLELRPKAGREGVATSVFPLPVCAVHQVSTTVDDLVGDEGWAQIVAGFAASGKAEPDRARTTIRWVSLAIGEAWQDGIPRSPA